jgi:ribosome recycling factor
MNKKDNLIDDWEKWCSNELLDKLKLLKTGKNTSEDICKTAEDDVQKLTDAFIRKIEEHLVIKEAEIMKV